jgi:LuxR family maltose regulon positive regulatory protein
MGMKSPTSLENQLLVTKFYVPMPLGPLVARPRLNALLAESLKYPLTLVSAPAGFGKTTLLSTWAQSLPTHHLQAAWISLDEEDNDPWLFWMYVLAVLERQCPERFGPLLESLQSSQPPPLKSVLIAFISLLLENGQQIVLLLDDYHVITNPEIHDIISYFVQHMPPQFHLIVATRSDPPLPLTQWRARKQILEVRTQQLRCTTEETKNFFQEVMGIQLPEETIETMTAQTEGWLVGLQLLGLSLPGHANPVALLQEISGEQRYILDFLTEEVLQRQPPDVQTFLLFTSILERLSAPLCDAVLEQTDSQQMLQWLERANLFMVSLDNKRQWYRYHLLFAQALRHQLENTYTDLIPLLHYRASLWYAKHDQTTQAILHALHAKEWLWAADLIEQKSLQLMAFTLGPREHELVMLQHWLEQLPADVVGSRPRLCLACTLLLYTIAPASLLNGWLDAAEATLTASLSRQSDEESSDPLLVLQSRQEQENLLGEVIAWRAAVRLLTEDGHVSLTLCQRALSLLSAGNILGRAQVANFQIHTYYTSDANDIVAAIESGLHGIMLAKTANHTALVLNIMGTTTCAMIAAGRLHEALQQAQQAMQLSKKPDGLLIPEVSWPLALQVEVLREWNELEKAFALIQEVISLSQKTQSIVLLSNVFYGYAILFRIYLSCNKLEAAYSAFQEIERISTRLNQPNYLHLCSPFTTVDQVRLWLACGELDRATRWAEALDVRERHGTPFTHEREEVACIRVLLAQAKPDVALQRLEPVLQRATTGQRWGHVIEIQLLQALAYQMLQQETQALNALSEAIRLAEPEGYIRSFVDEGLPIAALLSQLREQQHKQQPTPYLDTLLRAFPQYSKRDKHSLLQAQVPPKIQLLLDPLSEREQQVLQLLAKGASNQDIAQELVIAYYTVKRHISHIFSKLGVQNRIQAVKQAQKLGLLEKEP